MADTFSVRGSTYPIRSWDGGRLNTKAHGPGTLVNTNGATGQCSLNQGVISGYSWCTGTFSGTSTEWAQVYNTQGMPHGAWVWFSTNGDIHLVVYNNGEQEGSSVKGMMCIQYI